MTIENPAFCLDLYLTGVHFRGELQHAGHVGGQKFKFQPIRNREIGGVRLQDEPYVRRNLETVSNELYLEIRYQCFEINARTIVFPPFYEAFEYFQAFRCPS